MNNSNPVVTVLLVLGIALLASACGSAVAPSVKAPIHGEMVIDPPSDEEKEAAEERATELRKINTYSKATIGAAAVDNFVVQQRTLETNSKVVSRPTENYGDLNKPCEKRYQIAGLEGEMPLYGSREGAAEYALTRPDLFPPQGKEKEVVVIINEVCLDKYTDSELAVR